MNGVYLITGSNVGNAVDHLKKAEEFIRTEIGEVVAASSLYSTEPWGNKNQPAFVNQVLKVNTQLEAYALLHHLLDIEQRMGRVRKEKWEPRIIDIDILFFNNAIIQESDLTIPHPHLHERRFVLEPLVELCPEYRHPVLHKTVSLLLQECKDTGLVDKM